MRMLRLLIVCVFIAQCTVAMTVDDLKKKVKEVWLESKALETQGTRMYLRVCALILCIFCLFIMYTLCTV